MRNLIIVTFLSLVGIASSVHAFEINLPPHYREDLEKKRLKEAETLWSELDRGQVESAISLFVEKNPRFDGVDLSKTAGNFTWSKDGRAIAVGAWHIFLAEWELSYPTLKRVRWDGAILVATFGYDWKTKMPRADADAEIRLTCKLTRKGSLFSKKAIRPGLVAADFGEVYLMLPFGGVELRKSNQQPTKADGTRDEAQTSVNK